MALLISLRFAHLIATDVQNCYAISQRQSLIDGTNLQQIFNTKSFLKYLGRVFLKSSYLFIHPSKPKDRKVTKTAMMDAGISYMETGNPSDIE